MENPVRPFCSTFCHSLPSQEIRGAGWALISFLDEVGRRGKNSALAFIITVYEIDYHEGFEMYIHHDNWKIRENE